MVDGKVFEGKDFDTFKKLQNYVFNEFYEYTNSNRID